ncbi:TadE/TadG family type IV pilus assembly protein [Yoonia sp. MH D7]
MKRSTQWFAHKLRLFGRAEDGAIIVMTLIFLMIMLIVGGMGVDFMRFEARRALLQSTADRAVLAAADLTQAQDAKDVVIDYFEKAGFGGTIVGEPTVIDTGEFNSVGVVAKLPMNTFFLKLAGIDTLEAPAAATAIEGIANVEVSLAVDISGSMGDPVRPADGSASTQTKIKALQEAAVEFATVMLTDAYKDKISISLIPYSEQVNAGPLIFDELKTTGLHSFSQCIAFQDSDFDKLALSMTAYYQQEQHFQWNSGSFTEPLCPFYPFERISPWSQNLSKLTTQIKQLAPRGGTATMLGMKWATALLDPSANAIALTLANGGAVDTTFNNRPAAYALPGEASLTQKVIVLMTDGQNSNSERIKPEFYSTPDHAAHWASKYFWDTASYYFGVSYPNQLGVVTDRRFISSVETDGKGGTDGDVLLQQLCTKAKEQEVIIYTVAVEAGPHGAAEMAKCASSASHAFDVTGDQMKATFGAIARQITELRLSE